MSHIVRFAEGTAVEDRIAALEKYLTELQAHRDSRRGLDGARGPQGEPSTVPGPQGPSGKDGRDADMTQVVEAVIKRVRAEFDEEHKMLAHVVHHALITGGVLDSDGKAILIPGRDGRDSAVEGPRGRNGVDGVDGVNGKDGRNGVDGKDGAPGKDGVSDIPGPVGERGIEGERGIPGPGMSKEAIVQLVMDLKRRGSI